MRAVAQALLHGHPKDCKAEDVAQGEDECSAVRETGQRDLGLERILQLMLAFLTAGTGVTLFQWSVWSILVLSVWSMIQLIPPATLSTRHLSMYLYILQPRISE